jgi:hypothetical protein
MVWHVVLDEVTLSLDVRHRGFLVNAWGRQVCRPADGISDVALRDHSLARALEAKSAVAGFYPKDHEHLREVCLSPVSPVSPFFPDEPSLMDRLKSGSEAAVCAISNYDDAVGFSVFMEQAILDRVVRLAELSITSGAPLNLVLDFLLFSHLREAFEAQRTSLETQVLRVDLSRAKK